MHFLGVRTTLTIDDDVLRFAQSIAEAREITLGRAISELAQKGIEALSSVPAKSGKFPTFRVSAGARTITLEDVRRAEEEF